MKKQNKLLFTLATLLLLALILGSLCFNVYQLVNVKESPLTKFMYVLTILCYISALVYVLRGLKKNSAVYYKLFLMIYTITAALNLFISVNNDSKVIIIILAVIILLFRGILTFIEDLGKKVSYILSLSLLLITTILFFIYLKTNVTIAIDIIGYIATDIILFIMVYAKYVDKENRHAE